MKYLLTILIGATLAGLLGCSNPASPNSIAKYSLTVTSSHGSVTLDPPGGIYKSGTVVTLTASAENGYIFSNWSVGLTGTTNPTTITMNSHKNVTAVFKERTIRGTITIDTIWNKPLEVYHINGDLTINANVTWARKTKIKIDDDAQVIVGGNGRLTIEEGVEVMLGTGSYFSVGYSTAGTFIAKGSDSLPVLFTKNTGVQNWGHAGSNGGGIILYNKTTALTVIDHCIIEYATSGISVQSIPAVITNCKIRNNKDLGIDFVGTAAPKDSASFVKDSITGNGGYPISICAEGLTSLSGDSYLSGNTSEGILVVGSAAVTKSGTWQLHGVPYIFDDYANLGSAAGTTIKVEPGVICKFNTGAYIQVGYSYSATLIAIGTDSLPIIFTKKTGVQNWGSTAAGIVLGDKTTAQTVFDHCIVEYATSGFNIMSHPAVITYCKIRNNAKYGIDFNSKAMPKDSASFVFDSITGNGSYPISIVAEGLTRLSGNTYLKGNIADAIEVTGGNVTQSGTWKKHDIPYFFTSHVSLGTATGTIITINPGVVCKFAADAYIQVGYSNSATLIAEGTALDSIRFTKSAGGSPWGSNTAGIVLWDKTTLNTSLKYCVIDSAKAGISVGKAKIAVSNCSIRDNVGTGIVFSANGSPKDSASFLNNSISKNGDFGIKIYSSNLGNLSGTELLSGNAKNGIFVTGDNVDINAVWKAHTYVVDGVVAIGSATGATVTIRPRAKFEFNQGAYIRIGYSNTGALIADGVPPGFAGDIEDLVYDAIHFTGHVAGAFWGSASNDGAGIMMWTGTAATTVLKNCIIAGATGGVFVDTKATVAIDNCFIGPNQTYGIGYYNDEVPITKITGNTTYNGPNPSGDMINLHP